MSANDLRLKLAVNTVCEIAETQELLLPVRSFFLEFEKLPKKQKI
jgi:hypothetical protein